MAPLVVVVPVELAADALDVDWEVAAEVFAEDAALLEPEVTVTMPEAEVSETVPEVPAAPELDDEAALEVELVEVLFVPLVGAGVAVLGSVRAPVPQGMAAPPGWVEFVGGVVLPLASAMAKRVVHNVVDDAGEVNW